MKKLLKIAFLFAFISVFTISTSYAKAKTQTIDKITVIDWQIAKDVIMEAYIYAYPLMVSEITRLQTTNYTQPTGKIGQSPENQFAHAKTFPDPSFTTVVRPNVDTLYSSAWLNLEEQPMVVSVPNTSGRYYVLQLMDIWTDTFSAPGSRTTGTKEQHFILVGPNYDKPIRKSKLDRDNVRIIKSPTNNVMAILRMQTNGEQDYAGVHNLQNNTKITPYGSWHSKTYKHPKKDIDIHMDMVTPPVVQVANLNAEQYFAMFAELMKTTQPHDNDNPVLSSLEQIGFFVGESFTYEKMSYRLRNLLAHTSKEAQEKIVEASKNLATENRGWQITLQGVGSYGAANYLQRSAIAHTAWGANLISDAVYPLAYKDCNGKILTGKNKYTIHFKKDQLPPVNAFWSITMYGENDLLVDNSINRYALGSKDEFKFNKDGSLTIYIQNEKPSTDKISNWLPAPEGNFSTVLRMYWPKAEVKYGEWTPPGIERVKK
ncbi:MAG: DUF1254 domain-containing protein [Elusimicrobiaceae bacterium]|jgi:hypothetical protein|nr:DUF1254 domain-containing protein [Elusimicrobiaceae bacterium]MBT3955685.1 DUF1254 domain-containing protein [Elusimicrobiaceae bacterium]MBT4008261.1 DUF1254 domain-containing protein [Elusimicrobiaceae bacterium]MBT4402352.1 DUF1254 domain-containing protein [Elusimicrobiaceae bacterium]MBT4439791.1 DUF1254 domain-containing protein [Elusimicrobiaceae bacterium]